ncbi:MAG: hypothetical protein P1Q69_07025 [Candidatus Thorarchaeota archaeon]|nr:hypothetical protein [Candidatus Thorarchaeota archaeon]
MSLGKPYCYDCEDKQHEIDNLQSELSDMKYELENKRREVEDLQYEKQDLERSLRALRKHCCSESSLEWI